MRHRFFALFILFFNMVFGQTTNTYHFTGKYQGPTDYYDSIVLTINNDSTWTQHEYRGNATIYSFGTWRVIKNGLYLFGDTTMGFYTSKTYVPTTCYFFKLNKKTQKFKLYRSKALLRRGKFFSKSACTS